MISDHLNDPGPSRTPRMLEPWMHIAIAAGIVGWVALGTWLIWR